MTEPVAWGVLSTARINGRVLAGARLSERVEVVAVASREVRHAQSFAARHDIPRAYGTYDALLDDPGVQAVYIPLPNSLHIEWTLRALQAGKHVLCEKPLSRRADEVEHAFDAAERAGLVLSEAFMWRHNPQTATLERLLADGVAGPLRVIRAAFSFSLSDVGDVRLRADLDGGALMDVGCYCVSASRLFAGEPERVHAEQIVGPSGVDVVTSAVLRFPNDVLAYFDCSLSAPHRGELELIGERASLFAGDPWHVHDPGIEVRRDGEPRERIAVQPANSYQLELENVSDAIRGEEPLLLGREDALGQARALEALFRSADSGVPVEPASFVS